jgi:hypothetical protein
VCHATQATSNMAAVTCSPKCAAHCAFLCVPKWARHRYSPQYSAE